MKNYRRIFLRVSTAALFVGTFMFVQTPHKLHGQAQDRAMSFGNLAQQMIKMNTARAQIGGGLKNNLINGLRFTIGMIMGYSDFNAYNDLVCNGTGTEGQSCDGPPQAGIVGTIATFINGLPTVAKNAGITSCDAVPSSGSATGTTSDGTSITLNFASPTHTVPDGWLNGGTAFGHRVTFSATLTSIGSTATTIHVAYEFSCGSTDAYAGISMDMGNLTAPNGSKDYHRDIMLYSGPVDADSNGIQLFMAEFQPGAKTYVRSSHAIDIHYNSTTQIASIWGVTSANLSHNGGGSANAMTKVVGNGNYSTGKFLILLREIGYSAAGGDNAGNIDLTVASATGASVESIESAGSEYDVSSDFYNSTGGDASGLMSVTNGSPVAYIAKACVDFTSTATALAPSDSSCSAFSLSAVPEKPAIDSSGHWTITWALNTLDTKLEDLVP